MAAKILFLADATAATEVDLELFWSENRASPSVRRFAEEIFHGVGARQVEIDTILQENLQHWSLARLAVVDRAILRMAVWEMLDRTGAPLATVINEAIEIARGYSEAKSPAFINGVLDAVARNCKEIAPRNEDGFRSDKNSPVVSRPQRRE